MAGSQRLQRARALADSSFRRVWSWDDQGVSAAGGRVLLARAAAGAWTAAGAPEGEVALPSSVTTADGGPASGPPSARAAPSFRTGSSRSAGLLRLSRAAAGSTLAPSW